MHTCFTLGTRKLPPRAQVAEANRSSTPQYTSPSPTQIKASAYVILDNVQRMIIETMRAHHMQSQYAMRPGYMTLYPPEIDHALPPLTGRCGILITLHLP